MAPNNSDASAVTPPMAPPSAMTVRFWEVVWMYAETPVAATTSSLRSSPIW